MTDSPKPARGFARLTPEQRKEVSRKGGQASQETGRAHRWTSEEAQVAGKRAAEKRRADRGVAG